jgi:hypothetical protein
MSPQFELTTPEAILHASAGALGIITGVIALSARKGSPLHRRAGTVFFAVMLAAAATGTYLGFLSDELGNAIAGIVTLYLITTSWVTVQRGEGKIGAFEAGAFLFAATGAVIAYWAAFAAVRSGSAMLGGLPYMIIATIIATAAIADLSVLLRRGPFRPPARGASFVAHAARLRRRRGVVLSGPARALPAIHSGHPAVHPAVHSVLHRHRRNAVLAALCAAFQEVCLSQRSHRRARRLIMTRSTCRARLFEASLLAPFDLTHEPIAGEAP